MRHHLNGDRIVLDRIMGDLPYGSVLDPPPCRPRVERRKLVSVVAAELRQSRLVTFWSNPGHGASSTAADAARALGEGGSLPVFVDLSAFDPDAQVECLEVVSGHVCSPDLRDFTFSAPVVVDGLHDLGDADAVRLGVCVRALMRAVPLVLVGDAGCAPVDDVLPEHRTFGARDLLVGLSELPGWLDGFEEAGSGREVRAGTGGIASLVEARLAVAAGTPGSGSAPAAFRRRRALLLADAVARAPIREERMLRAAVALLGEGPVDDLRLLGVEPVPELVASTYEECPVLGIDRTGSRFSVVGGRSCPARCVGEVSSRCPDLVFDAVQLLVSRGRFSQAIPIAERCFDTIDMLPVAVAFPVELFDAGGASLLRACLSSADDGGEEGVAEARRVLAVSAGQAAAAPAGVPGDAVGAQTRLLEDVVSLYRWGPTDRQGRDAARRGGEPVGVCALVRRAVADRLEAHVRIRSALVSGSVPEAMRRLAREEGRRADERSLGAALLDVDAYLCRRLQGHSCTLSEKAALAESLSFLRDTMPEPWAVYEEALCWTADVVNGTRRDQGHGAEALSTAVRRGDRAMAATVQCAMAMADLSCGRAGSASAYAHAALDDAGGAWVRRCCAAVLAVAAVQAGDGPLAPMVLPDHVDDALGAAMAAISRSLEGPPSPTADRDVCPDLERHGPDATALFFVEAVLEAGGPGRERLWALLPELWRDAVRRRRSLPREESERPSARVQVGVLGSLRIRVDGAEVDPRSWRRGSARNLVAFLAVREGHMCYRHELFSDFWPDRPVERALQAFYQAMTAVRKAFGVSAADEQPLVCRNGIVALVGDLVDCDIDRLRSLLQTVFGPKEDDERVDAALAAASLYGTGLFTPSEGPWKEFFESERLLLEGRYLDALVRGAHLARGCARERDGLLLAQGAYALGSGREDVAACYARLLMDNRRFAEADMVCREQTRTSFRAYGAPPSPVMADLSAEVGRALADRGESA